LVVSYEGRGEVDECTVHKYMPIATQQTSSSSSSSKRRIEEERKRSCNHTFEKNLLLAEPTSYSSP